MAARRAWPMAALRVASQVVTDWVFAPRRHCALCHQCGDSTRTSQPALLFRTCRTQGLSHIMCYSFPSASISFLLGAAFRDAQVSSPLHQPRFRFSTFGVTSELTSHPWITVNTAELCYHFLQRKIPLGVNSNEISAPWIVFLPAHISPEMAALIHRLVAPAIMDHPTCVCHSISNFGRPAGIRTRSLSASGKGIPGICRGVFFDNHVTLPETVDPSWIVRHPIQHPV